MELLLVILGIALLIATYRDIKTREVPDTLNYGLIVIGLLGGLGMALVNSNLQIFLEHLYGFLIGAVIGIVMFYGRQWGGGDAKLIMGVGAILGFSWANLRLAEFVILLVFCGAAYGLVTVLYVALITNRKRFVPAFAAKLRTQAVHRLRMTLVGIGVLILIMLIFVPFKMKVVLGFVLLGLYVMVYSWIFMKVVEKELMVKEYPIAKLTEGDWVVHEVKLGKKIIVPDKSTGITLAQIAQLKKTKIKSVMVKEGIPFVPGFLLAFAVLLITQHYGGILKFFI